MYEFNSTKLVDFFLSYLKNEKRLSLHTALAYKTDLLQFSEFLQTSQTLIENANASQIRTWIVSLSESGLTNTSINRKIASLKAFYKLLVIRKKITRDPTSLLKSLKTPKRPPVFLEEKNITNLFENIDFEDSFFGLRDKLIMEFLYGTGVRLSELKNIKNADIDLLGSKVKVLGKRSKYRIIPLHKTLLGLIKTYQDAKPLTEHDFLLLTDKNQPVYAVFIQRKVKFYIEQISTIKKKSPHIIRHTFATHLLNRGADLNAIKELLGHSNLSATQIYTHNSISKLKEAFTKAHPKA